MNSFNVIAAADDDLGIGLNGDIPWRKTAYGRADMRFFAAVTTKHTSTALIMGRLTAESIPKRFWPLAGRLNVVVTSEQPSCETVNSHVSGIGTTVIRCASFNDALLACANYEHVFVIGGHGIYAEALRHPACSRVFLTRVPGRYGCGVTFPTIIQKFKMIGVLTEQQVATGDIGDLSNHDLSNHDLNAATTLTTPLNIPLNTQLSDSAIRVNVYVPDNPEERAYIDLLRATMSATLRENRTGISARGGLGATLRFQLGGNMPLLTTKRIFWRSVFHELLWFMSGDTDTSRLRDARVHIWDANTSAEALSARGLTYPVGSVGPAYGHQWRRFGGPVDALGRPSGPGLDQLQALVAGLQQDPYSRRHVVTAWNPAQTDLAALPPCHILFQMYVQPDSGRGRLSTCVYMRSSDIFLGLPFNIASYALLTYLCAHICGFNTGELVMMLGDYHLYENHITAAQQQISRQPTPFPTVTLRDDLPRDLDAIVRNIKLSDVTLHGYRPQPAISAHMAV